MSSGTSAPSSYRLATAHVLRALGPVLMVVGALWAVVALVEPSVWVRGVLALVTLTVVAVSAVLVARPPRVLALTEGGYRISLVRGAGARAASWRQVEAVGTRLVGDALSLVITLDDGRASVLPLSMLGAVNREAQREVHERLNAAHGYRRIDPA